MTHCHADIPISLIGDASNAAVGAVLQQRLPDSTVPLTFFSRKLFRAKTRYSTFGRERLAVVLALRHFQHLLEGREFAISADHKPLIFAQHSHSDKLNPWEIRHLDYISQFTSNIRHIDGSRDEVADALPRSSIAHLQLSPGIDLAEMAAEQRRADSPCEEDVSGLQIPELLLKTGNGTILCDVSNTFHCPFVPPSLRRKFVLLLAQSLSPWETKYRQSGFRLPRLAWDAQRPQSMDAALFSFLGCTRIRKTAYHPAANGMVKRFHRQLKTPIRAANDVENRIYHHLLVLRGIRSALKPDLDCSAAELVFGATVRLPGAMIWPNPRGAVEDPTNLLHRLRQLMRSLSPVQPKSSASPSYLEKDLATSCHVYH
ncbi:hypothetical protein SprV_0200695400 [Sparganum proliferum]